MGTANKQEKCTVVSAAKSRVNVALHGIGLVVVGSTKVLVGPVLLTVYRPVLVDSHVVPSAPGTHKPLVVVPEIRFYPALALVSEIGLVVVGSTKVLVGPVLLTVYRPVLVDSHVVPSAPGTHKPLVVVPEIRFYPALALVSECMT
ncbi:hypothetical protein O988_01123 [Pseudogymnoascus sp. VKM F-3808]|nr:hypothetical protein O988_01123 [Pseudogymnoascus sp. VKM F-3808]